MPADRDHSFSEREIVCPNEAAARAEAQRQQRADEDSEHVEWIYLRNKAGAWVARRTPLHLAVEQPAKPKRLITRLFDALSDFPGDILP